MTTPHDPGSASKRSEEDPLAPAAVPEHDVLAVDVYGAKVKAVLGDAEPIVPPPKTQFRPWREFWPDCLGSLQGALQNLFVLIEAIPAATVGIVRGIAHIGESIAIAARRVARGRSKVDHHEDEQIAAAEEVPASKEPSQAEVEVESAQLRIEDVFAKFRARGIEARIVRHGDQLIVVAVQPGLEDDAVEAGRQALIEARPELPKLTADSAVTLEGDRLEATAQVTTPIENLRLAKRIVTILKSHGITTREELASKSFEEVLQYRGIGDKSIGALAPFVKDAPWWSLALLPSHVIEDSSGTEVRVRFRPGASSEQREIFARSFTRRVGELQRIARSQSVVRGSVVAFHFFELQDSSGSIPALISQAANDAGLPRESVDFHVLSPTGN